MKTKLIKVTQNEEIKVEHDTQFVLFPTSYSSEESFTLDFVFTKSGIKAEIIMVYILPEKGMLNVTTIANHKTPSTSCLTKVRGILMDRAVSNYVGKILIDKNAQQTSSFLEDDVLVVGHKTKNNSQPILMIEADDVRASHGATTGRINEEEVYYLATRGLERPEAEQLIVEGFLSKLINEINDEKVREEVLESLKVKV